ncbi:hypothetical protein KIP88_17735 [Bradyrhizobium sp. SRL28]|uniref:hypothetical protein n=1 Tax=Bradyrhizobium sp. SRL28 TaxID=2836178 RepID=UPI001BDF3FCC|nr:hypothetical protein [Bradyrhizobium sp. SRL28]MBT1512344.1 hypothetical protein [Bradyrhizobium sp. SRL28]
MYHPRIVCASSISSPVVSAACLVTSIAAISVRAGRSRDLAHDFRLRRYVNQFTFGLRRWRYH